MPSTKLKRRKSELDLLGATEVYRLIKQHPRVQKTRATDEQIKAVFLAYKDIMYVATKKSKRISLPHIGQFLTIPKKGWQGGYATFDVNKENYIPPKPDYLLLTFQIDKALKNKFRKDTEADE